MQAHGELRYKDKALKDSWWKLSFTNGNVYYKWQGIGDRDWYELGLGDQPFADWCGENCYVYIPYDDFEGNV